MEAPADMMQRLQEALGDQYRIERELAAGGMSRLFLATEVSLRRPVVIKLLPPETASEVSEARFRREMELAASLQHPHILPILAAGTRGDLLYYLMPFIPGESLRHRMEREGRLPVDDAVRILRELAGALAYAHRQGVVHRDIKPENVLVEEGHAVLTDFGVARALAQAGSSDRLTSTGLSVGTPGYMAPEQVAGDANVDARADIYALAVIGFEMLAGQPPFRGDSPRQVLAAHMTVEAPPLRTLRSETPAPVAQAIGKALSKDPEARFQTAGEFQDALAAAPPPPPRRRTLLWTIGAVALLLLITAGWWILRTGKQEGFRANHVAIAPFDVIEPDLALWSEGLVDLLSRNLDGAGPLTSVPPTTVIRQWKGRADRASAEELARQTRARLVVYGDLVSAGRDSVRLRATLLDAASGRSLGELEHREAADRIDLLADSVTVALLRQLNAPERAGGLRISSLGSTSLPAIKAFLRGEQHLRRSAWEAATQSYEQALALDSTFALAHNRLALSLGWSRTGTDSLSRVHGLEAGARNHGLSPRDSMTILADSLRSAMFAYDVDTLYWRHLDRAQKTLQEMVQRYPDDAMAWYELGELRMHFGFGRAMNVTTEEVRQPFLRAIALDSTFAPAYIHPVELSLRASDTAAAHRFVQRYLDLGPTDASAEALRVLDAILSRGPGDLAALRTAIDTASPRARDFLGPFIQRWPGAVPILQSFGERIRAESPVTGNKIEGVFRITMALATLGRLDDASRIARGTPAAFEAGLFSLYLGAIPPDSARRLVAAIAARRPDDAGFLVPIWYELRDTVSLRRLLETRRSELRNGPSPLDAWFMTQDTLITNGFLALSRADTNAALRYWERGSDSICVHCVADLWEARVLAARGEYERARALLPVRLDRYASPMEVPVVLERGRVSERMGDRADAIESYAWVVGMWSGADSALQPLVRQARDGLSRLTGETTP